MTNIDINAVRAELAQALSKKFDDSTGVAIYGAGDTAERWFNSFLDEEEITPKYFIDDTPSKRGTTFLGKPIVTFEEAHTLCKSFVIVLCSYDARTIEFMSKSFHENPVEKGEFCSSFDEYVFCTHAKEILDVFDFLEDDLSKATYANLILARMGKAKQNQELVRPNRPYFEVPEFTKIKFDEVFVDCGAYVGDTIEQFLTVRLGEVKKVFAFEPSDRTFRALKVRTDRLIAEWGLYDDQIKLVKAGVGEEVYHTKLKTTMKNDYATCAIFSEKHKCTQMGDVTVYAIDAYFAKEPISFLKADIEGYEWKMIHGAKQVIKRDRPKIAVCIYHSAFDMYRIALKLKELCPEYKFAVRQHYCDIWDTVLYAYV